MEELLASETVERALRPLRSGESVEGTVAQVSGDEATIDLGDHPAGVLALRDAGADQLYVGDRIVATVVRAEGPDGRIVLSLRRARGQRHWERMSDLQRSGELVEAEVIEANRGGVVVDVGLRGFVPLSQLGSIGGIDAREPGIPEPVRALVGTRLRLCVIEADAKRDRLILSEKAATQHLRRERKAEGVSTLSQGDVLDGTIVKIATYGVFVDVGVADGLVHRTEITWDKSVEPTALLNVGQPVRVLVVGIDRERQRISLSLKRLADDPWDRYAQGVQVGQTVEATVTRLMPYGAFARVEEGVEGLIHVSEVSDRRVGEPREAVRVGDVLPVKIVGIDRDRRRLSLSARLADRA
jgi:small subunit ribosomal protein S1